MRWSLLLYPFAIIYDLITRARNHLYNIGSKPSFSFEANVIAVGNLSAGGTGKSPMIMYLIDHFLRKNLNVATLSRGYGRSTSGYRDASEGADAQTIGDESAMYALRYGSAVQVTVCEHRALAIPQILADNAANEVILLDDAFQHRVVDPSLSLLLTTYQHPFYVDHVLPAGTLREARIGAGRADLIIVTNCPKELDSSERDMISTRIKGYAQHAQIFFTFIDYQTPVPMNAALPPLEEREKIVGVSGIAQSAPYFDYLSKTFLLIARKVFRDHKHYRINQIKAIDQLAQEASAAIMLTEKDMVKWKPHLDHIHSPVYYLPISVGFIVDEDAFVSMLDSCLKNYDRDY